MSRMVDPETGDVECPCCGYFWPPEKVKGICDQCKAAETAHESHSGEE